MKQKPLPVTVSVLGNEMGLNLSPEQAIERTRQLLARASKATANREGEPFYVVPLPRHKRMSDETKIKFLFERGRWPTPEEQRGWY
jgi:Glu-tRNA(Gln) amidotransferase subunit E-like FAD-binding protein